MSTFARGNRRRREEPRIKLPQIPWASLSKYLGVVVAVICGMATVHGLLNRSVERVVMKGAFARVSQDQLEAILRPAMGQGFLAVDLATIQARVSGLPWVATARVNRQWPGTLEVRLTEEQPVARWNADGLLNTKGRLFVRHATHIPSELPQLRGPNGTEVAVAARYVTLREQLLERGLGIAELELDRRGAWTFMLSNGIGVRLGSRDVESRLTRFFAALDTIVMGMAADVQFMDMRYTNGFSLGWKTQRAVGFPANDQPMTSLEGLPRA